MINFLKTASAITGDEYKILEKSTPPSRKKVKALAVALLVPVIIWGTGTYMLVTRVMNAPWHVGLLTALPVSLLVFTIERLIIMANGNRLLSIFRVSIGLCMALLGAVIIDDVLFTDAINSQMEVVKEQYAQQVGNTRAASFSIRNGISEKNQEMSSLYEQWRMAENEVAKEADGTGGSGKRGVDIVTKLKKEQAGQLMQKYEARQQELKILNEQMAEENKAASEKAAEAFSNHNLLFRIKALFQLVSSDNMMLAVYFLFTTLMFLLEFLVIIFKKTWEKTAYEYEMEKLEWLHKQRTDRIYNVQSQALQPHITNPVAAKLSQKLISNLITIL